MTNIFKHAETQEIQDSWAIFEGKKSKFDK